VGSPERKEKNKFTKAHAPVARQHWFKESTNAIHLRYRTSPVPLPGTLFYCSQEVGERKRTGCRRETLSVPRHGKVRRPLNPGLGVAFKWDFTKVLVPEEGGVGSPWFVLLKRRKLAKSQE